MEEREYEAQERRDEIPEQRNRRKQSLVPVIIFTVLLLIAINLPIIIYAVAHYFHRNDAADCCFVPVSSVCAALPAEPIWTFEDLTA